MYVLLVLSIHDNQRSGASVSCSSTFSSVPLCLDHSLAAASAPCLCKVRRCALFTLAESNNALAYAQDMQAPAPRKDRQRETLRLFRFGSRGWLLYCRVVWVGFPVQRAEGQHEGNYLYLPLASAGRVQGMTVDRAHEIVLSSGGFFQKRTLGAAAWRDPWPGYSQPRAAGEAAG